jgi:hypothetical protein
MGSQSTFTNSKGVKKSGEHRTICQTPSLMLTPNVDVKYGVRRAMHDSERPAHRLDRSPLPLTAAVAIYPHEDCVGNGRFRCAEYRSFSALYWSRSKAIKPQQIVPQAEFIGGKNEACHNRSHTTANPKQLTLLKMRCQV